MSWLSKAVGRERMRGNTARRNATTLAQQKAQGGVLDFQNQIDTAGRDAGTRGKSAQDQYLKEAQGFDPTAAIQKYASAQWDTAINDPTQGLKRQLTDLKGASVGAGRLDTGFFDADQGDIIKDVTRGYGNSVASTALRGAEMGQQNSQALGSYGERQTGEATDIAGERYSELQNNAADKAERRRAKKRGIGSAIGSVIGAGIGSFGGPQGASVGAGIGSSVGGGF